ncbi:hypothetical protein GT037_003514, partial [Alternaria burnsii]
AAGRAGANPRLIFLGPTELYPTLLGVVCRHEQSTASRPASANGEPYARDEGRGVDLEASRKPELCSDRLKGCIYPC